MGETAIVTGGAGFIGSHIVDALLAAGLRVVVLDNLSSGRRENVAQAATLEVADLRDPDVEGRIASLRPELIVHCAAQPSVPASFHDPVHDAEVNLIGGLHVIRGALASGARRFVYITTGGALYGAPVSLPCREDDPVQPRSPYGWTKYMVEKYLELAAGSSLSWVALRLANVYGPRQLTEGEAGVVAKFAERMRHDQAIVIDGDGEQTRDFIYVGDVVVAVLSACTRTDVTASVNVGTGVRTSINELYRQLARVSGYRRAPEYGPPRPGDIRDSALASDRAAVELAWQPRMSLAQGLQRTYEALASG